MTAKTDTAKTTPADLAALSFEAALQELEKIVRTLESGSADLKSSIESYERGMALKKLCETRLKEAESRIEKITLGDDGAPQLSPFTEKG